jgi:hypothetical protein
MKKSELRQLIREEILESVEPKPYKLEQERNEVFKEISNKYKEISNKNKDILTGDLLKQINKYIADLIKSDF